MAAYRRVYNSRHLQVGCQEPGSAPEAYARQSSRGYLSFLSVLINKIFVHTFVARVVVVHKASGAAREHAIAARSITTKRLATLLNLQALYE